MRNRGECGFCSDRAVTLCEWPVERFRTAQYKDLKVGDRVRRALDRLKNRPAATVSSIAPWFAVDTDTMPSGLQVCLEIRNKTKEIIVRAWSPVQVERRQPCGMPVCENHLRSVEPGVEYCRDHWESWSAVA